MEQLLEGLLSMTWKQGLMILIGLVLIYLAIRKEYEPMLLLPIGLVLFLQTSPYLQP